MTNNKINPTFYKWLQSKGYTTDKNETTKRLIIGIELDGDTFDIISAKWYDSFYDDDIENSQGWRVDYQQDYDTVETIETELLSDELQSVLHDYSHKD